ncbi:hypothetical protein [Anaerophilus nitritogenes]|uniref:hypothetical protein n=1 Tax=Anaerophilus nitritogenes TaxID=2498136 RepID=UPI00101C4ED9|nr:hypothetical protein [Anaerophilus nitritogenes]
MKNYIHQDKGSISIGACMIGMLLFMLLILSTTLFLNHYHMISSHLDSIKAYYLAESGIDEGLYYCSNKIEEIVSIYLKDRKEYQINYTKSIEKNITIDYKPPVLYDYFSKNFIPQIQSYKKTNKNPFYNYNLNHSYETQILCNKSNEGMCILIESLGIYNYSKKYIKAVISLPKEESFEEDLNSLPIIKISPLQIKDYFQYY